MLAEARIRPGVAWWVVYFPSASGGLPPRLLPPFEGGWVNCPAPEAPLTRGMPTGPRAFLGTPGACRLRPCTRSHLKKGFVPYLPVRWGGQQIPPLYKPDTFVDASNAQVRYLHKYKSDTLLTTMKYLADNCPLRPFKMFTNRQWNWVHFWTFSMVTYTK